MAYARIIANVGGKRARREILEGRSHLVAEGVALKETVIPGSGGKLFYPAEENGKDPQSWNGMPIVLYHPQDQDGEFTSARVPEHYETRKLGTVFNSEHLDDDKDPRLKMEFWFDEERTKELDERVFEALENGTPIEISTGLGLEPEWKKGEFKGEKYDGIARNHKPDHVAVLPDKVGALPVKKGGGIFANAAKEPEATQEALSRSVKEVLNRIGVQLVNNELSFSQATRVLSDLLASEYGEKGKYWNGYVCEVYPDYVIFSDGKGQLFKVSYTATDGSVKLSGKAVQVVRTVEYKEGSGPSVSVYNTVQETEMAFDKKAHVDALIANGQIEEGQRAAFEALDEKILQGMKVVKVTPVVANQAVTTPPVVQAPVAPSQDAIKELFNQFPQFAAVYNQGQKALTAARAKYTKQIKDNPKNVFTDEALAAMDVDTLAATAELASSGVVANEGDPRFVEGWQPSYLGQNGFHPKMPVTANAELEDPLEEDGWGDTTNKDDDEE